MSFGQWVSESYDRQAAGSSGTLPNDSYGLGGVVALGIVLVMALRNRLTSLRYEPLKLCATYWHVLDGLWVYLFLLLLLS